jgi:glutathione S-transferase
VKRVLHQFPISHYCEKTRWNLDAKGLEYETRDLLPLVHILIHRRFSQRTVPLLFDGERVVPDSTGIALYLEERYPEVPLVPVEPAARAKVLELEDYFDREAGPAVRRFVYGTAMARASGSAAKLFFRSYEPKLPAFPRVEAAVRKVLGRGFEAAITRRYRIAPDTVRAARASADQAMDRVEREIGGDPRRYLVGDRLSLADIAAASLLGPLVAPPESPWGEYPIDPSLENARTEARARVAGRWIAERYACDRKPVRRAPATAAHL